MNYVCTDLHGQYIRFLSLVKKIRFCEHDEMFILGDVIDRGPNSIDMLIHALTTPNIHLLIGNHEHMMIEAYETDDIALWCQNGGESTLSDLQKYPETMVGSIVNAMKKLPIVIPNLIVGDRSFYLCHACPVDTVSDDPILYSDASPDTIDRAVWDRRTCEFGVSPREYLSEASWSRYKDHTFLLGHTPTIVSSIGSEKRRNRLKIVFSDDGQIVNLDCGCAMNRNLGCIRLEDMKEFYV